MTNRELIKKRIQTDMLAIDLALFGKRATELGLPVEWLKDWQEAKKNAIASVYVDHLLTGDLKPEAILDAYKRRNTKATAKKKAAAARKTAKKVAKKAKKSIAKHVKRVARKVKDQFGVSLEDAVAIATWLVMDEITLKALLGQDNLAILDMIKVLVDGIKNGYITVTEDGSVEVLNDDEDFDFDLDPDFDIEL